MNKYLSLTLILFLTLLTSGCMEQTMLINVKPDGSGTMRLRMFMSDQIANNMAMAGAMGQEITEGLPGAPGEGEQPPLGPGPDDLIAGIKHTLENQKDEMGEGVTFIEGKEVTNKKGWKGYEAVYRFEDINKITASTVEQESSTEGPEASMGADMGLGNMADFSFKFTPGTPARLEIMAQDMEGNMVADAETAPAAPEDAMAEQMAAAMMGMMKPMLAGMRMTSIIRVEGEVVNTNAKHRGEKNQNAILLYDIDFDKVLAHPDGMKLLSSDNPAKAAEMDIPGLRMQDLKEPVFMEFK